MNILRLSTFSLVLALAVVTLGYVGSASADPKPCEPGDPRGFCQSDPGSTFDYTVDLVGPDLLTPSVRGTFEFSGGAARAILESKGRTLTGDEDVTMARAGANADCNAMGDPDTSACMAWNSVFNLCGLLGPDSDPSTTNVDQFTVQRRDWSVSKGGGRRWISFGFTIDASDSPVTERDLSASLQLISPCSDPVNDPSCENDPLIPTTATTIETLITHYSIHLRGKGGVTHQARCHAGDGPLGIGSYLVITAN